MRHAAGRQDLALGQLDGLPHRDFVLVANVGRLKEIGLRLDRQHQFHDIRHRDVVGMRTMPAAPTQVIADLAFWNVAQRVIQRLDAQHAVLLVGRETHLDADPVPQCGHPGVIDLHLQTRRGYALVLDAQGLGECMDVLFLGRVELVRATDFNTHRRRGRDECIGWRHAAQVVEYGPDQRL